MSKVIVEGVEGTIVEIRQINPEQHWVMLDSVSPSGRPNCVYVCKASDAAQLKVGGRLSAVVTIEVLD